MEINLSVLDEIEERERERFARYKGGIDGYDFAAEQREFRKTKIEYREFLL